jgi:hypothetical protein
MIIVLRSNRERKTETETYFPMLLEFFLCNIAVYITIPFPLTQNTTFGKRFY